MDWAWVVEMTGQPVHGTWPEERDLQITLDVLILRPISLLTLSLLTLLELNFPGQSLGHPYGPGNSTPQNNIVLESNPLKSTMLVGRFGVLMVTERLVEYGWKPHRVCWGQKGLSRASIYRYVREKHRVWFHRIRDLKQYCFNSIPPTSQSHCA